MQEDDFEATLAAMVAAALQLIPGTAAASVSVAEHRRTITSHAASSDLPVTVDRVQEEPGEGPGLDAVYAEKIVRVPDFRQENRWPSFAPAAAEAGAQQIKHLTEALATRDVIGQAKGILMERYQITARQAFAALTTVSYRAQIKLREVAQQLATTGVLPDTTP
jgi:hypothetical protein